ncbi:LysR family transcriptional regulator [Rhodospirillaceae bacterium KN72]|uniref:LysR family transcriptional regulator n=1 Tax=Pacificispira spongiicola TaxID=2729598 RepID=A0A7Y0DY97_9PROT|nr:LysR family transcriptional regulator [Pacificispira spongiicola]NMM43814.1 LysR family transcriptional regulator [Pacificispira spongiicola]
MDLAPQMILFAKVVEEGGFSAAARREGLTPSAISKQIGQLEDRLGVRLLHRSTRRMSLTEEGKLFYERCVEISKKVADAEEEIVSLGDHPQGLLRIAATVAFGKTQLLPILTEFLRQNEDVRISLELTDRPIDLVADEVDVAIRFAEQIEDSSSIVRKIANNRRVCCAAPSYVERFGYPETPADLLKHNCLTMTIMSRWNEWELDTPTGRVSYKVSGNFQANSADAVYHAALAGIGIARLSTYLIGEDIAAGRLVRILPDHVFEESSLLAVYSDRHNLAPKTRAFVDYLAKAFSGTPPWERGANSL